jgi:aspartate aminotransferase
MTQTTITPNLSQRVLNMQESATLMMAKLARQVRAEGHDVIALSLGEPDFDTPEHIKEAAKRALDEGKTKYTPVPGIPELREAIVHKFRRDNGLEFNVNQIVVSNGAKQSIANLCLALLNDGDEAILFSPYWVSYYEIVRLGGGVPVPLSTTIDNDFKVTPEQLEEAITPNTKMIIFSSPCNPSGSVYSGPELMELAEVIGRHKQIIIVSDEIYEYINFSGAHESIGACDPVLDQTVTVNGFSKGFAMTGWRLGYIGGPEWIADACTKIQGQFTSGATAFGQAAAAYALESPMKPTYDMCAAFKERRWLIIDLLEEIPGLEVNRPQGAFYIFPKVSAYFGRSGHGMEIQGSSDLAMYLLRNAYVATVAGSAFGDDQCMRISYAASEDEIREAIRRIGVALGELS